MRAVDPDRPRSVWLRHTVHQAPGEEPVGSIWLTVFDGDRPEPLAYKESSPEPAGRRLAAGGGEQLRPRRRARRRRVRRRGISRGPAVSRRCATCPSPSCTRRRCRRPSWRARGRTSHVSGKVTFGGEVFELDGWPGMIGHNWGAQHAERWIWLHGVLFEDRPDDWLDIALGRIRVGRVLTPWVANGVISLNGERVRIGGLGARLHANEGPSHLDLNLHGHEARLRLTVHSNRPQTVVWRYADPDGGEHHVANCSIAELEAVVIPRDGPAATLRTRLRRHLRAGRARGAGQPAGAAVPGPRRAGPCRAKGPVTHGSTRARVLTALRAARPAPRARAGSRPPRCAGRACRRCW